MKNSKTMDGEHCKRQEKTEEDSWDSDPDPSNVLQPTWVRCPICPGDNLDQVLLDYGFNFLLPVGILFWTLFFIL
jgi:hypothetical protein